MITINYTLTKEDYSHYVQYVALHASGYKRVLIKNWLIRFFIYGAFLFLIKLSSPGQNFDSYFFSAFLLLYAYLLFQYSICHIFIESKQKHLQKTL